LTTNTPYTNRLILSANLYTIRIMTSNVKIVFEGDDMIVVCGKSKIIVPSVSQQAFEKKGQILQTFQVVEVGEMITVVLTIIERQNWEEVSGDTLLVIRIDSNSHSIKQWKHENRVAFSFTPCCDSNAVFVFSPEYCVIALSIDDGTERWRTNTNETPLISKLVLSKDNLVLYGDDSLKKKKKKTVAIDTETGDMTSTDMDTYFNLATGASSDGNRVSTTPYTEDTRKSVECWDCDSGKKTYTKLWSRQLWMHGDVEYMKVHDNVILVRVEHMKVRNFSKVYALHLTTGKCICEIGVDDVSAEPAIVGNTIVIASKKKLMSFDMQKWGSSLWTTPLDDHSIRQLSVVNGRIYTYGNEDTMVFDATCGTQKKVEDTETAWDYCSSMYEYVMSSVYGFISE